MIQDIQKHVVDKGLSKYPKEKVGDNLYNRGVYNSMLIAEAIRNAQKITGKKVVTGEDVRRGLESLNITEARLKELGMEGFAAPVKVSCDDHNGHHKVYVAEWDGTKWTKGSDWIEPMRDKVRPLIEAAAKDYATSNAGWPKRTRSLREVLVADDAPRPLPAAGRGARSEGAALRGDAELPTPAPPPPPARRRTLWRPP